VTGADATRGEDEADTGCTRRVAMYDMKNTNNSAPIAAPKVRVTVNLQEQGSNTPAPASPVPSGSRRKVEQSCGFADRRPMAADDFDGRITNSSLR
jgi:hypothetical protein